MTYEWSLCSARLVLGVNQEYLPNEHNRLVKSCMKIRGDTIFGETRNDRTVVQNPSERKSIDISSVIFVGKPSVLKCSKNRRSRESKNGS